MDDVHLNVAQVSGHYYGNAGTDAVARTREPARARAGRLRPAARRCAIAAGSCSSTPTSRISSAFLETGLTPMRCHALRASCFIDPWGVVYPVHHLLEADRPPARHRHAARADLERAPRRAPVQARDLEGRVSAVLDRLRGVSEHSRQRRSRRRRRHGPARPATAGASTARPGCAMNVACFTDADRAGAPGQRGHAPRRDRRVGGDRREEGSAEHRRRDRSGAALRRRRSSSSSGSRPTARRQSPRERGARVLPTAAAARARRMRRAIPHIRTPVTVFLDADGSHDPEDIPLLVEPILAGPPTTCRRRGCAAARASCTAASTSSSGWPAARSSPRASTGASTVRLSDSQNGFRAIRTGVLRAAGPARGHDDDRAGDDHQDAAAGLADGRGARATSIAALHGTLAHPGVAQAPRHVYVPVSARQATWSSA